jgi:fibronectin-binding autotransporter adhesin
MKSTRILAALFLTVAATQPAAAQSYWSGQGVTENWNEPANWEGFFPPNASSGAVFTDFFGPPGHLTNRLGSSLTIPALAGTAVANEFATLLPAGVTLTLGPTTLAGAPLLRVGTLAAAAEFTQVTLGIAGAGTLAGTNPEATVEVHQSFLDSGSYRATLDLSGLSQFSVTISNLRVGAHPSDPGPVGTLRLAHTNFVTTAANPTTPGILLGAGASGSSSGTLQLGAQNTFSTDGLVVGGHGSGGYPSSWLGFAPGSTGGLFTLRGSAGGASRTAVFAVGDATALATGYTGVTDGSSPNYGTTADLTGGNLDARVDSLVVARSAAGAGDFFGWAYGTLRWDAGVLDANSVAIGQETGENFTSASGEVLLGGSAQLDVQGNVSLASRPVGQSFAPLALLAINDQARINIRGDILDGGGTSTLKLSGGLLDLQPAGDPTPGNLAVAELLGAGTITNAGTITIRQRLEAGDDFTPGTLGLDGDLVLNPNVALKFNVNSNPAPGGLNDFLRVGGNLTLNDNPLALVFDGPLTPGAYHLIDYAGTLSGSAQFYNPTRLNLTLDHTTPHHLDLLVSGAPGNLVWSGIGGNEWNTFSPLWNGDTELFYTLDNVTFNDAGVARTVAINGEVQPGSILVSGAGDYSLEGWGSITGFTGLEKNGPGTLSLAVGGNYRGAVQINDGILVAARYGALGATNGGTYVAAGATLDIAGQFMGDIEPVSIAGTGFGGIGAVVNRGGASLFGLRSLTLTADAAVAVAGENWGISGAQDFEGLVDLAGHTLTKNGAGVLDIRACTVTNAGSILVSAGTLRIRESVVAGPGTIQLGANELAFWNSNPTGHVAKAISVNGGRITATESAAQITGPVSVTDSLTISNDATLTLDSALDGTGAVRKEGPGTLVLNAANGFSGPMDIRAGQVVLGPVGNLWGTTAITVEAGASLDFSARDGSYPLGAGKTLTVEGTVTGELTAYYGSSLSGGGVIDGSLLANSDVTVGGDGATRTLTVTDSLATRGATFTFELTPSTEPGNGVNDLVAVGGSLHLGVHTMLVVRPVGVIGGTYTLLTYAGALIGTPSFHIVTPSRYIVTPVDPATTPGEIRVQVSGNPASLVWRGGAAGAATTWDLNTTTNWLNGVTPSTFREGDLVTFNDSSLTNRVTLVGELRPAGITANNATRAYRLDGDGRLFAASLTNNGVAGFSVANAADNTLTGAGLVLNSGTVSFDQPVDAFWTSRLQGAAALAKLGTNTLTFASPDSTAFTGDVFAVGGTLRLGSDHAFGPGRVTVNPTARLDLAGHTAADSDVRLLGNGPDGSGAVNNLSADPTSTLASVRLDGPTTLGAAAGRWTVIPGGSGFQGQDHPLTKTGPGEVWIASESPTGIGALDVAEGLLVFAGAGTTLGNPALPITVRSNASLGFGGDIQAGTKPTTVLPGGSLFASNPSNHYAGPVTLQSGLIRLTSLSELDLAGPLDGPATLRLVTAGDGGGRLTVSGTNTHTGGTEINVGTLVVARTEALPSASTVVLTNTGMPYSADFPILEIASGVVTRTNTTAHLHSSSFNGHSSMITSGGGTWAGPVILEGDGEFRFDAQPGGLTFAGPFTSLGANATVACVGYDAAITLLTPLVFAGNLDFGSLGLGELGAVYTTLNLATNGNSWDTTYFRRGRINLGADNALPLAPIQTGTLAGNDHRCILDLAGHAQTIVSLQESFLGNDPITIGNSSLTDDARLTYDGDWNYTLTTWSIVDGLDSGPRQTALTVASGVLSLVGTNTYTGPTLVTGGTLLVGFYSFPFGSLSYTGQLGYTPVTVSDAGTLGGNGMILGPVTIAAGGTLAPGESIGALTLANTLTLSAEGRCVFEVDLGAATNDLVTGLFEVRLGGTLVIEDLGNGGYDTNTVLKLFDAQSYVTGPVVLQPAAPAPGLAWDTSMLATDGTLRVKTSLPAPAITSATMLPNGSFSLTLTGEVGQPYSVLASADVAAPLSEWTVLETGTLSASPYVFVDPTATNAPLRFYLTTNP